MNYFLNVTDLNGLKSNYRKLAAIHHPDRGGCQIRMQHLNQEYQHYLSLFKKANAQRAVPTQRASNEFANLKTGDTVYVNGTESEVTYVSSSQFRVVAKGRSRQAVFDRHTGVGVFNARLRASLQWNGQR